MRHSVRIARYICCVRGHTGLLDKAPPRAVCVHRVYGCVRGKAYGELEQVAARCRHERRIRRHAVCVAAMCSDVKRGGTLTRDAFTPPPRDALLPHPLGNKIGTSYEAFSTQGNPCQQPAGTCLSGSPSALYAADVARISRGAAPLNFLSAFRDSTTSSTPFPKGGAPSVASIQSAGPSTPGLAFIVPTQRFQKSALRGGTPTSSATNQCTLPTSTTPPTHPRSGVFHHSQS